MEIKETSLINLHKSHGAKLVEFAGYNMPIQYSEGILIYAIDLLPNRIGLIGGLFYGLNFGLGGIAAGFLGLLIEKYGIEMVYFICSFMPLAGLMVWFLPRMENT